MMESLLLQTMDFTALCQTKTNAQFERILDHTQKVKSITVFEV